MWWKIGIKMLTKHNPEPGSEGDHIHVPNQNIVAEGAYQTDSKQSRRPALSGKIANKQVEANCAKLRKAQ